MSSEALSPSRPDLYPSDPAIEDLLNIKAFSEKFDIKDFIGAISEKLITQSKATPGPFDPKPFIRSFDTAVDTLINIRKDVQRRTEQQEQSSKTAEKEYSRKLADLNRGFESVGKSFSGMESKITEVGRTAVRIGEQLESVHIARQRAQAAHDIVSYWNQLSRGDTSKIEALRKEGREGRQAVAVLLRRLNTVAKDLDVKGADQTREELEKYCEKFEKDMLRMFDRSYRKGDPKMMKHCALTLLEFNGGVSCVQIYVNQHDFFISKSRVNEENTIEETQLWEILPDPNSSLPKKDLGLAALLEDIRSTVSQEAIIIQAVFPNPPVVLQVFLQRVFEQSIQQHLEQLLEKAGSLSNLAFLRVLQLAHVQVSKLVQDLKSYDLSVMPTSSSRFNESMSASASLDSLESREGRGLGVALPIGLMLDNAMEEIFTPYIEGAKYLEKESKSLGELYAVHLAKFTKYHDMTSKAGPGNNRLLDRMVNRFAGATSNTSLTTTTAASAASSASSAFAKLSGMASNMKIAGYSTNINTPVPALPSQGTQPSEMNASATAGSGGLRDSLSEADGVLNIDVAEKMLKWHAEAIGRCVEMSPPSEVAKNIFALSRVLAEAVGTAYMGVALESTQLRIESRDPKLEPDLSTLAVIHGIDMICHLWQQYVSIALIPLTSSSVTVRRETIIFNTETLGRVEAAANALDQKTVDGILAWLTAQLAKQKKNDFRPKNDDQLFARVSTEPCTACCETLDKVRDAAYEHLSGVNRENFLMEVGLTFHGMLLEHLKRYQVSANGGLMLAKDLKAYQDTISSFGVPILNERFEFIRQLGNVFLVRPEILKSYITEDELGRIDPHLLRPFLQQRSDWGQFASGFDDVIALVGADQAPANTNVGAKRTSGGFVANAIASADVKGLRERLGMGKLNTMMKELEALRPASARGAGSAGDATSHAGGAGGGTSIGGYSMPAFSFGSMYN